MVIVLIINGEKNLHPKLFYPLYKVDSRFMKFCMTLYVTYDLVQSDL